MALIQDKASHPGLFRTFPRVSFMFLLVFVFHFFGCSRTTTFEMANENDPVEVTGKVYVAVADYMGGIPAKKSYVIKTTDAKTIPLTVQSDDLRTLADGKTVLSISGTRKKNAVSIHSAAVNIQKLSSASANTVSATSKTASQYFVSGTRSLLLVLFNFPNDQDVGLSSAAVNDLVYNDPHSMNGFYLAQSFNRVSFQTDVVGYYTLSSSATTSCDPMAWGNDIIDQVINDYGLAHVNAYDTWGFISRGNSVCGGMVGLAYIGTGEFWINGDDGAAAYRTRSLAHEYGHTLGLDHAHLNHCVDPSNNAVPISTNCTVSDTGDAFDGMSYEDNTLLKHFSGPAKAFLGWLPSTQITTISPNTNAIYTLIPLEASSSSGTYMLQISRSDGQYYYVDFRQPSLSDPFEYLPSTFANGVEIHLSGNLSAMPVDITLVNNNPTSSSGAYAAPVSVGQTFTDSGNSLTIRILSVSSTGAQVQVIFGSSAPTTPITVPSPSPSPVAPPIPAPPSVPVIPSVPTHLSVRRLQ